MRNKVYAVLAAAFLGAVDVSSGAVNFGEFSVTQVVSPEVLAEAIGTTETAHFAGVATYPAANGPVYLAQSTRPGYLHIVRADVNSGMAVGLTDTPQMALNLGAPYVQNFGLQGGFAYSLADNRIYLTDFLNGTAAQASLLSVNPTSGFTSLVSRTTETALLVDFSSNTGGHLTASYQPNKVALLSNLSTADGQWSNPISETQFIAASGIGGANLTAGSVGASAVTDDIYFYCSGDKVLFHISTGDFGWHINRLTHPQFTGAEISDIAVDEAGNMFAYDVAGDQILILRKLDDTVFTISMNQIGAFSGGITITPLPLRGLAARKAGRTQADLFIGSTAANSGLLRIRFGDSPSAVNSWELY